MRDIGIDVDRTCGVALRSELHDENQFDHRFFHENGCFMVICSCS